MIMMIVQLIFGAKVPLSVSEGKARKTHEELIRVGGTPPAHSI
jgi:hypothetical protein